MLIWSVIVTGFGVLLNKRGTSLKTLIICINNTHSWQDLTQVPETKIICKTICPSFVLILNRSIRVCSNLYRFCNKLNICIENLKKTIFVYIQSLYYSTIFYIVFESIFSSRTIKKFVTAIGIYCIKFRQIFTHVLIQGAPSGIYNCFTCTSTKTIYLNHVSNK